MVLQYLYDAMQVWIYLALVSVAFSLASLGCRHFNMATGLGFLVGPYVTLSVAKIAPLSVSLVVGCVCSALLGIAYQKMSVSLFRAGARPGQQLIISLAVLTIGQNLIVLLYDNSSHTLWPVSGNDILISSVSITVTRQQIVYLFAGCTVLVLWFFVWYNTLLGVAIRGLVDSRFNMLLKGYNVGALEGLIVGGAFLMAGVAGVMWGINLRFQPAMGFEVGIIGFVASIVGPMLIQGPAGILAAALLMTLLKLLLSLVLEGDWAMASYAMLLGLALFAKKSPVFTESAFRQQ